jgi:trimethylamine---corrinoid protein Co-methyltransferase
MRLEPLIDDDVERIHLASLEILETTGIWFLGSPQALALLGGAGARVEDNRAFLPRSLVEEALASLPPRETSTFCASGLGLADALPLHENAHHVLLIGNAYYWYDYARRLARDCQPADLTAKYLVLDGLCNVAGDCCNLVFASERQASVNEQALTESPASWVRRRAAARAGVLDAREPRPAYIPPRIKNQPDEIQRLEVLATFAVAGREATEHTLRQWNRHFVWCNPISPLQYAGDEADGIISAAQAPEGNGIVMISPEILMGATGPVTMAGTLAQHNAEVLGGTTLAQVAHPGTLTVYGCVSAVMDMRSAEISQGHYETATLNAAAVQMADHYGMPSRIASGNSSAREPGPQAAAEMAVGLYLGLASGANLITTGLLDSTLMISLEHLILLDELVALMRKATRGIEVNDATLAMDQIQAHAHPSPGYITSEHTRGFMRHDIAYSTFGGRSEQAYRDWYEQAHDRVQSILAAAREATPDPILTERIDAIAMRLAEDDETWRQGKGQWWLPYVQGL